MQAADYEQALEAVREWYAVRGRLPRPREWETAARGRPTTRTIRRRRWGWDQLMAEATGMDPAEVMEEELRAYRRQLLLRLRTAHDQLGRWPGGREWEAATADHPARRTYVRHFGSVRHEALCQPGGGERPPPSSCRSSLRKLRAA
jgi:hypothetical protein